MLQKMLELFTTEEKAMLMLESPIIKVIFSSLFILFVITFIVHIVLFLKIRRVRNYVKDTNDLNIKPLQTFKEDFNVRQKEESVKLETFIQEKFSSWTFAQVPIISFIKLIKMTISVFILLGVLGTFIGLTISLSNIHGIDDQLIENVSGVLSGIDIAFYTSIVGMSFSLIMTLIVKIMNTEYVLTDLMLLVESKLESDEQYGMDRVIHLSEEIHGSLQGVVTAFDGFKEYTSGLEQSAKDLSLFNEGLSENLTEFNELFQQMKVVTDGFSDGTNALNKNFTQLFNYFTKADARNERIVTSFEKAVHHMENVTEKQMNSFTGFSDTVEELKQFTSTSIEQQTNVTSSVQQIEHETKQLVTTMTEEKNKLKHIFGDDLTMKLTMIANNVGDLGTHFNQFGNALAPLASTLEIIQQTQAEQKQMVTDRLQELNTFNQTFSEHLRNHQMATDTFEKHMRETSATYEQMTTKNSQFLSKVDEAIRQLSQTFSERDQQLQSNVTMVKDAISSYVNSLDGTLSQKLDTLIRNVDSSMYQQQDDIKRDYMEMRRMSDEINENNIRTQQQLLSDLTREIQSLSRQLANVNHMAGNTVRQSPTRIDV